MKYFFSAFFKEFSVEIYPFVFFYAIILRHLILIVPAFLTCHFFLAIFSFLDWVVDILVCSNILLEEEFRSGSLDRVFLLERHFFEK